MGFVTDIIDEEFGTINNIAAALNSTFTFDNINGYSFVGFSMVVPTGGTVDFEGSFDGTTFIPIHFKDAITGTAKKSTSVDESLVGSIMGLRSWRVKVTVAGSAAGTVMGKVVRESSGTVVTNIPGDNNPITITFPTYATSVFGAIVTSNYNPIAHLTFPHNINTRLVSTTVVNSGTVTQSAAHAVVSSGTNATGSAVIRSRQYIIYRAGVGAVTRFACRFDTPAASNTMIVGIGDASNGLFFGYNGTSFGILRRDNTTDNWIPQTSWNTDAMDGTGPSQQTLNPQFGNVYQIKFQWLGYGQMVFMVENATTGRFQTVHMIEYANANSSVSMRQPSFPICAQSVNSGNTTSKAVYLSSAAIFYEGQVTKVGILNSAVGDESVSNSTGSAINVISIINKNDVFGGTGNNRSIVRLKTMNISNNNNRIVKYIIILNPTSIAGASYTDHDTNTSVISKTTTDGEVTGGTQLYNTILNQSDVVTIDLSVLNIAIYPGEEICFAHQPLKNGASGDLQLAVTWSEEIA